MADKRVLVFGQAKAGKTSLINALTNNNLPLNNTSKGSSFDSQVVQYSYKDAEKYEFVDIIGFNEANTNTDGESAMKAVEDLKPLFFESVEGFSLLIHVIRSGSITRAITKDHDLFCRCITSNKIPVLVVVTHCENEEDIREFISRNSDIYQKQGIYADNYVGGCFRWSGPYSDIFKPLVESSANNIWEKIRNTETSHPVLFIKEENSNNDESIWQKMLTFVWRFFGFKDEKLN